MRTKNKTMEFFVGYVKESYGVSFGKIDKKLGKMKEVVEATNLLPLGKDRGES